MSTPPPEASRRRVTMSGERSDAIALFSRDPRTHGLFRAAWMHAIEAEGGSVKVCTRGQGLKGAARYVCDFIRLRNRRRIVFGTSEIVLLAAMMRRRDLAVFTGLGRLLQAGGRRAALVRAWLRVVDRGQSVIVLNDDDAAYMRNVYGRSATVLAGEGYRFVGAPAPARAAHLGRLRLAYAGRMLRSKGVDRLVEACVAHDDLTLLLLGDLDFGNSDAIDPVWLQEKIAHAEGRIVHVGFVDDVRDRLRAADVYVSLSKREGLPFGVLDAVNAGCALLLTNVPGHREFARFEGVTFVEPDLDDLTERLKALRDGAATFDREHRLAQCERKFGFQAVTNDIKAILSGGVPDERASVLP